MSEKELKKTAENSNSPEKSRNIFNKFNIDRYLERTYASLAMENTAHYCFPEFLAYYTLENKLSKTGKYQAGEFDW